MRSIRTHEQGYLVNGSTVTKLDPSGRTVLYRAFVPVVGTRRMVVDEEGSVYVAGSAFAKDLPAATRFGPLGDAIAAAVVKRGCATNRSAIVARAHAQHPSGAVHEHGRVTPTPVSGSATVLSSRLTVGAAGAAAVFERHAVLALAGVSRRFCAGVRSLHLTRSVWP